MESNTTDRAAPPSSRARPYPCFPEPDGNIISVPNERLRAVVPFAFLALGLAYAAALLDAHVFARWRYLACVALYVLACICWVAYLHRLTSAQLSHARLRRFVLITALFLALVALKGFAVYLQPFPPKRNNAPIIIVPGPVDPQPESDEFQSAVHDPRQGLFPPLPPLTTEYTVVALNNSLFIRPLDDSVTDETSEGIKVFNFIPHEIEPTWWDPFAAMTEEDPLTEAFKDLTDLPADDSTLTSGPDSSETAAAPVVTEVAPVAVAGEAATAAVLTELTEPATTELATTSATPATTAATASVPGVLPLGPVPAVAPTPGGGLLPYRRLAPPLVIMPETKSARAHEQRRRAHLKTLIGLGEVLPWVIAGVWAITVAVELNELCPICRGPVEDDDEYATARDL